MCDWSYGRLIAAHLTPKGSSYTADFENFVAPKSLKGDGPKSPLTLTDVVIGDDGALYFTTGGRNTQSGLYRVSYTGDESTAPADLHDEAGAKERAAAARAGGLPRQEGPQGARRRLAAPEQRRPRPALRRPDRGGEPAGGRLEGAGAGREAAGGGADRPAGPGPLRRPRRRSPTCWPPWTSSRSARLTEDQQLEKLRVLAAELHPPGAAGRGRRQEASRRSWTPSFPSKSERVNRELAQILIYLRAPHVAEKCLRLAAEAKTQEDQLFYVFNLRTLPIGNWTMDQRKEYFGYFTKDHKRPPHPPELLQWFADAGRPYGDGASFPNYMKHIFAEATANLSDAERKELAPLLASIDQASVVNYETQAAAAVKEWKTAEMLPTLDKLDHGRNFDKGRQAYLDCQCIKCHRFGNEGGAVGPDLTAISSRFAAKDILESILEPSKVVSEQYQNIVVTTKSGQDDRGPAAGRDAATRS